MGDSISGIIIKKSSFDKGTQVEECEQKTKDNFIVRFQRPASVSTLEHIFRFFSDMLDGVTKVKESLCDKEALPSMINVKGRVVKIQKQTDYGAEGTFTEVDKHSQIGGKKVTIVFLQPPEKESPAAIQKTSLAKDASGTQAVGRESAPLPPPRENRPPLSNAQQPPTGIQPPELPSRDGRRNLNAANEGVPVRATQNIVLPPPPPPITFKKLTELEQNLKPADRSDSRNQTQSRPQSKQGNLNDQIIQGFKLRKTEGKTIQNAEENSTKPTVLDQIKQGVQLRKAEVNPKKEPLVDANSDPQSPLEILKNKMASIKRAHESDENEGDSAEWDEKT